MAVAITAQSTNSNTSLGTTISFAGQAIGTAAADRIVFVAAAYYTDTNLGGGNAVNSCTIGGVAATLAKRFDFSSTVSLVVFWRLVASGTTATIAFDVVGGDSFAGIQMEVYSVTGADTTSPVLATATNFQTSATASAALSLPTNGGIIGVADGTGTTSTWTNLTRDLNAAVLDTSGTRASTASTITQGGTITYTSGTFSSNGIALVSIQVPVSLVFIPSPFGIPSPRPVIVSY